MNPTVAYVAAASLFTIGLWAVVFKDNLIKKVMGLTFIVDAVNLTIVTLGYRQGGLVPILAEGMDKARFAAEAAYPLPMALVLTNIVIGVATVALILGVCVKLYSTHGTLSSGRIWDE